MRFLLDTHIFLWLVAAPDRISGITLGMLGDPANELCFSPAVAWEIAIKRAKGQLAFSGSPGVVAGRMGLRILPIQAEHCEVAGELPPYHRDPFDRLLIAQAQVERLTLVTADRIMSKYGVAVLRA